MVVFINAFLIMNTLPNICYGCGSQNHNSDACSINIENIAFRVKKVQEPSQVDYS